jgi:hypothetical protein
MRARTQDGSHLVRGRRQCCKQSQLQLISGRHPFAGGLFNSHGAHGPRTHIQGRHICLHACFEAVQSAMQGATCWFSGKIHKLGSQASRQDASTKPDTASEEAEAAQWPAACTLEESAAAAKRSCTKATSSCISASSGASGGQRASASTRAADCSIAAAVSAGRGLARALTLSRPPAASTSTMPSSCCLFGGAPACRTAFSELGTRRKSNCPSDR